MRTKALAFLAALALLTLAPVAAQETGYEAEGLQAVETEATAEVTAEATAEATAEPMAPEAVELDTAEVPDPALEPAVESTAPLAEEQASEELPRTASPLALLALLGLGSAGSALGLRSLRRK